MSGIDSLHDWLKSRIGECCTTLSNSKLMLYDFELGHNAAEAIKNIRAKSRGTIDHGSVTRLFKKFHSSHWNLDEKARSGWPQSMGSQAVLQAIVVKLASNTWRISGELNISQSSVVCHFNNYSKRIWSCWIMTNITEILQIFWVILL